MKELNDTRYFHFFNANPKNRRVGDCVARAISVATGKTWETTVMEMTADALSQGNVFNDPAAETHYLTKTLGYPKQAQPRKIDGTKYTGAEFCKWCDKHLCGESVVAHIGGHHIVCIKPIDYHYKVWDIWDSTEKCIGNYWIIKEN